MPIQRRHMLALSAGPWLPLLTACGGGGDGGGSDGAASQPSASGRVVTLQVNSKSVGTAFPISVFVPASHDAGAEACPTIWANDGDAPFGSGGTRFATLRNVLVARQAKALLIGVGAYLRRQTDYNFPGAYAYHDFLTQELIPLIESQFRCDPRRRMLTGLSTGGSFAATALFIEAAAKKLAFSVFLSVEGAFWQQQDLNNTLEQQMADAVGSGPLPVTLILARGERGQTNAVPVSEMYKRIEARRYNGLNLIQAAFPADHVGTDAPALDDAISRNVL